jgi:methionyl-tRNA formyltransferase
VRTVFFGTPDFAVPSLRALLGEGFDVAGVVTQPDKPQGRSRSTLVPPPVKTVALEDDIPVFQPERPTGQDFYEAVRRLQPDLGVVIAYGHILKPELLAIPRLGMINIHASLLPRLRGAAPIQHALLSGMEETGVSVMQLDEGMDTGPVLLNVATPILADETAGELTDRLSELGALALIEAMELLGAGELVAETQDHAAATYAPKITREQAHIDWTKPAAEIARMVRAMDPKPGAWTSLGGKEVKLYCPRNRTVRDGKGREETGRVTDVGEEVVVQAGDGSIAFSDVQPSGKERMSVADWARGRGIEKGKRFE